MARTKRRTFEATGPFVARVAFPFGGETFFAGEVFPHGMVPFRKLRQLYDCRRINFSADAGVLVEAGVVELDGNNVPMLPLPQAVLLQYRK